MPLPTRPQRYCDPASLVFLSSSHAPFFLSFLFFSFLRGGGGGGAGKVIDLKVELLNKMIL